MNERKPEEATLSEEDWNRWSSDYQGEFSDEELDRAAEEYLRQMTGQSDSGMNFSAEKIENPRLKMTFDHEHKNIRYELPNGSSFSASVPAGMLADTGVYVKPMENAMVVVHKDEAVVEVPENGYYREPGSYQVTMTCYNAGSNSTDYNLYQCDFDFRILPEVVGALETITAPEYFQIQNVSLDGEVQKLDSRQEYPLKMDGSYRIVFADQQGEGVGFQTEFVRDSRAPQLIFTKEITGGRVEGPVSFEADEENCRFILLRDGIENQVDSHTISTTGYYVLTAVDQAGNAGSAAFSVIQHYQFWDWRVVVILFVLLLGAAAKLLNLRNNMKVT